MPRLRSHPGARQCGAAPAFTPRRRAAHPPALCTVSAKLNKAEKTNDAFCYENGELVDCLNRPGKPGRPRVSCLVLCSCHHQLPSHPNTSGFSPTASPHEPFSTDTAIQFGVFAWPARLHFSSSTSFHCEPCDVGPLGKPFN